MASAYDNGLFCLLQLSIVLACISGPSVVAAEHRDKGTPVELPRVCDGTINPRFCWEIIRTDYSLGDSVRSNKVHIDSDKVDSYRFAEASINLAEESANDVRLKLGNLVERTTDHQLRKLYKSCYKRYKHAIRHLEHAKKSLHSGQYQRVAYQTTHASKEASQCGFRFPAGYLFSGRLPGYSYEQSKLSERIQDFDLRCSIVNNIAAYFPRHH